MIIIEVSQRMNMNYRSLSINLLLLGALVVVLAGPAHADDASCTACHEQIVSGKSVHPAVAMGCASCHSAVDAADVPHKITNRNPKGLIAKMKDLCFNCHDRGPFQKTTVHGALRLGCTTCHNPHATDHARILKEEMPGLCLNCHAEGMTAQRSGAHAQAGNAACSNCHQPHATDTPNLVLTQPEGAAKDQTAMSKKPAAAQQ